MDVPEGADVEVYDAEVPGDLRARTARTRLDPNRRQMMFGEGSAMPLDVTAHEVTHAITEMTAGLEYQGESGALNEAISDVFASNLDPDDWEIGEDLPGGAIRDMADPERYGQPAHTGDRDASEQIVYAAVTEHLGRDSGFEDFRAACRQASEDRYGRDSAEYRGVGGTWEP